MEKLKKFAMNNKTRLIIGVVCIIVLGGIIYAIVGKPIGLDDQYYKAGVQTISIVDKCLDYEISAEEANKSVSAISNTLPAGERLEERVISIDILSISSDLSTLRSFQTGSSYKTSDNPYNSLKENRNSLAKKVNKPTR